MNIATLLDMAADGFGERIVAGRAEDGVTAARLRELSAGAARKLAGAGALVHLAVNGPAFPVALFAAARAGVPLVPLNYRLGREQLDAVLAEHPRALGIADPAYAGALGRAGLPVWSPAEWLAAAESEAGEGDEPEPQPEAPAVVIYTSGTTSAPKGVILHHHNLVSYVLGTVEFAGAGSDEAALMSVPPYHIAAVSNVLTNLYAGRRVLTLEQFTPGGWLDLVRAQRVTNAMVVPTMLARLMDTEGLDRSVPSLRALAYGGAKMPVRVIETALRAWPHVDFVNAYGLTETSSTISVLGPEDHRMAVASADPVVRARLGSAGRPLPSIDLEVRNETGAIVAPGEPGQIWVRGEQVSGEYAGHGSPLDERGFFPTRDQGRLDADGYLHVEGRLDDTIIRGAENIAPAEIEDVLLRHPDVLDAVVVGVPDEEWGQRIEAVVVPRAGADVDLEALRATIRATLRGSKTPDRIVCWPELPRTATGKLVRRDIVAGLAGPKGTPTPGDRPLPARLRRVLAADPGATALTFEDRSYPWAFLRHAVDDLDRLLAEAGAPDAHRIGIVLRNRPGHLAALVAVIATGRQVVTLSPFHGDVALAEDITTLAPQVVVAGAEDWARPGVAAAAAGVSAMPLATGEEDRPLRSHPADWTVAPGAAERGDVAVLMQTSGTTGRPKRVELTYRKLTAAFEASGTPVASPEVRLRTHPSILWTSLVHIGGLYFAIANVAAGLPTALLERFDVRKWAALVRRTRPRRVRLAPTALRMVLQSDLPADTFDGVEQVSSGTAPLPPDDADRFTARFGVPVLSVYGATEFAGAIAGWDLALYREWWGAKRGSVGRAFRGIALRIVDRETGEPVPAGTAGVLEAKGAQLPDDGWVRTTDLASLDDDGFLFVHGRADDAINRGGFKIVPSVIEEALRAHPAVRDASAVGIPDERLGEVPVAAVTMRDGARVPVAELLRWLAERLARYHLPTEVRVVDELPRTPSMKVSRPDVQALFRAAPAGNRPGRPAPGR